MKHIYYLRILSTVLILSWPTLSFAHAQLKSTVPAVGSSSNVSPTEIRLTFSEAIEAKLSKVDLMNESDTLDEVASVTIDPNDKKTLIAKLKHPLPVGHYMIMWRVVSVDTHKTQGDFSFEINP
jgi:methionine-rich copper-binding protein CopC